MMQGKDICKSCAIWVSLIVLMMFFLVFSFFIFLGVIEKSSWLLGMFNKKPIVFFLTPIFALSALAIVMFFKLVSGEVSVRTPRVVFSESASQMVLWIILFLALCGGTFIIWQLEYPSPY